MMRTRQLNSLQQETGATKTYQNLKQKNSLLPAQIRHKDWLILRLLKDALSTSGVIK
jgi:hypothetical protein